MLIDKMLRKLSSSQGCPSKRHIFWSCDLSDWWKCHRIILWKISQGYCIYLPNMKRICLMVAKLLWKENADLAESLLPYTNNLPHGTLNKVLLLPYPIPAAVLAASWRTTSPSRRLRERVADVVGFFTIFCMLDSSSRVSGSPFKLWFKTKSMKKLNHWLEC